MKKLDQECNEILRKIICKYKFLQPANKDFDCWDNNDAANVIADLIIELNKSEIIQDAHNEIDWGK